ncbi:LCP family protein [Streptomyces sp. NPDC054796]
MSHESGNEARTPAPGSPAPPDPGAPGYGPPAYGPPSYGGPAKARRGRRRGLKITAWAVLGVLLLGGGGLAYFWSHLNGNLKGVDVDAKLGHDRPSGQKDGSMNILLLGSDSRAGANSQYGEDQGGARADTAMVLHVDKSHKKASVVSIPRDTEVQRPRCADPQGGTVRGEQQAMFNESYQVGGPACTMKTVEKMSGLRMDHYLQVDFTGFKKLIDELGGVDITTDKTIKDDASQLSLTSGTHKLKGEQALQLVRTRHGVGDGSDLGRIQLQQAFIKALIHQVDSIGLFGNPAKTYDLADTATRTVSADSDLASTDKLLGLAKDLKGIKPSHMNMTTLPVTYDPQNQERVLPLKHASHKVWTALRHDDPIPKSATKNSVGDHADTGVTAGG